MRHCHYTCDMCQRVLDPEDEVRYVVNIDVRIDDEDKIADAKIDEDRDHLEEIADALSSANDVDEISPSDDMKLRSFHLCRDCLKRFLADPLGRRMSQPLDFSKN